MGLHVVPAKQFIRGHIPQVLQGIAPITNLVRGAGNAHRRDGTCRFHGTVSEGFLKDGHAELGRMWLSR